MSKVALGRMGEGRPARAEKTLMSLKANAADVSWWSQYLDQNSISIRRRGRAGHDEAAEVVKGRSC